jgi:hypothetical protein
MEEKINGLKIEKNKILLQYNDLEIKCTTLYNDNEDIKVSCICNIYL